MDNTPTLLNYAVLPTQLQVGATDASLLILVAPYRAVEQHQGHGKHQSVEEVVLLEEIELEIGFGEAPNELTNSTPVTSAPEGRIGEGDKFGSLQDCWSFGPQTEGAQAKGKFVARPTTPAAGRIGADSIIVLKLSGIAVNTGVGLTELVIREKASSGQAEVQTREVSPPRTLTKTDQFQLEALWGDKSHVEDGGSVTLAWAGSSGADYYLGWDTPEGWQEVPVPAVGHYPVSNLRKNTTFHLRVMRGNTSVGVGPNNIPNRYPVTVIEAQPKFNFFRATWQEDGDLLLEWDTEHYEEVSLKNVPGKEAESLVGSGQYRFQPMADNLLPSLHAKRPYTDTPDTWKLKRGPAFVALSPVLVGQGPHSLAIAADGSQVFSADFGSSTVTAFDAHTLKWVKGAKVGKGPLSLAVSPDGPLGSRLFVACHGEGQPPPGPQMYPSPLSVAACTVLDARTLTEVPGSPVTVHPGPRAVAVSGRSQVFVTSEIPLAFLGLSVFHADTLIHVESDAPATPVDGPFSMALSPDGSLAFIANYHGNSLAVLDAEQLAAVTMFPLPVGKKPISVAVSPSRIFVVNSGDHTLTVLDGRRGQREWGGEVPGSPVSVGKSPMAVAVSPDGLRVFVANYADDSITVLDADTLKEVAGSPIKVGKGPVAVAVSASGSRVFVANYGDNTVSVLTKEYLPQTGG